MALASAIYNRLVVLRNRFKNAFSQRWSACGTWRLSRSRGACLEAANADGRIGLAEGELVRMIAATLDCPVPPLLAQAF